MHLNNLLDRLIELAHESPEFRHRARYLDSLVRLGIDDEGFLLRFRGGHLIDWVSDRTVGARWDYEISGPRADWERMWKGEIDLTQAIIPVFGSTVIRGDLVLYASQAEAIIHLLRLLPVAASKLGVDVAQPRPPAPEAGPEIWRTSAEVVGRYVEVNGVRTYYESIGERDGPVAFIGVHTAGRDCRQWQRMGAALSTAGRFYSFDLPGHAKSWPVPTAPGCLTTMAEMSAFTWSLRSALGIDIPTVFLGCSMAGNLALQVAADFPDDVAATISMQGADHTPTQPEEALALMDHPQVNPSWAMVERTAALIGDRTPRPVREYLMWEARNYSSVSIQADLRAYGSFDNRPRAGDIRCPVLFIRGSADWIVGENMVYESAARLTNSPAVEVDMPDGVGHFAHVEQPQESAERVLSFLREHGVL